MTRKKTDYPAGTRKVGAPKQAIEFDPQFSRLFPIDQATVDAIIADGEIREPLAAWNGLLVDGHTRYAAAKQASLPYRVEQLPRSWSREQVLDWAWKKQCESRRNLSNDQIAVLAAQQGRSMMVPHVSAIDAKLVAEHAEFAAHVLGGRYTVRQAVNRIKKAQGLIPRRTARQRTAPAPHIAEGQELKGESTLVDAEGNVSNKWIKTHAEGQDPIPLPPEFAVKSRTTMQGPDGSVRVTWTTASQDKADQWSGFKLACAEHVKHYAGLAAPAPEPHDTCDTLTVYPLGDPHAGMLAWAPETGEHHDLKIWEERIMRAMDLAVATAPPSREAWIVNLGDALHAQNAEQRTPNSGHKLDVDGRHGKVMRVFFDVFRRVIDRSLRKHETVRVFNLPGNHDPEVAAMIAMFLGAVYENEPRVHIDSGHAPYVYRAWGSTLIGMHHGDGAKHEALPLIMANDVPELWGAARFKVWLTGHVHHMVRKDFPGCSVESFRILPPGDFWHKSKGYRAPRAQHTITYHPTEGEILRGTFSLETIDSHTPGDAGAEKG